ncbi:MAG: glycosyltransferase family 4 protein [Polyangiaceae bacterium]|nr:glycosyltransferase family 4 protein [Polyangiaceae bacterium]
MGGSREGRGKRAPLRAFPERPPGQVQVSWMGGASTFGWPGVVERSRHAPWKLAGAIMPIARAARAVTQFDHVVAHWIVPSAWPIALFAHPRSLEVWAHGADVRLLTAMPVFARSVIRRLLEAHVRFVFVAQPLLDAVAAVLDERRARALVAASRIEPAPIDVPPRDTLSDPRDADRRTQPYAVWVGRATRDKRADLAARAARDAGVQLVVVGDGPALPASDDLVRCVGRLPRVEALRWIAHASALVSTSEIEGSPTVVREARALGVPVVSFPAGDVEEAARNDDGIHLVRSEKELSRWLRARSQCST